MKHCAENCRIPVTVYTVLMELAAAAHISSLSAKCGTGAGQRGECAYGRQSGGNSNKPSDAQQVGIQAADQV